MTSSGIASECFAVSQTDSIRILVRCFIVRESTIFIKLASTIVKKNLEMKQETINDAIVDNLQMVTISHME